jgi:hypothetical protein
MRYKFSFLYIYSLLFLLGCNGELLETLDDGAISGDFCPTTRLANGNCPDSNTTTNSWGFSNSSNYTYNSNLVEISSGKASLKTVDQFHSESDFNNGTHTGTTYINNKVSLRSNGDETEEASLHLNQILPSKSSSLIGYWRFDNDYNDSSGNSNHGSVGGNTSIKKFSRVGRGAAHFDTSSDYISVANSTELGGMSQLTIGAWVWLDNIDNYDNILNKCDDGVDNTDLSYRLAASDNIDRSYLSITNQAQASTYAFSNTNALTLNRWRFIVAVYNGTSVDVYIDGVKEGVSGSTTDSIAQFTNPGNILMIGHNCNITNNNNTIDGYLDEVFIYNTALSDNEVKNIYEKQNSNNPEDTSLSSSWTPHWDDIVGYWKMDGDWQDSSGNDNHGSAVDNASFSSTSKVGSQAGTFDGDGDFVTISNSAELEDLQEGAFTMQAWYRPSSLPDNINNLTLHHGIFNKPGWHTGLKYSNTGAFFFDVPSATPSFQRATSPKVYTPRRYYHVVGVSEGPGGEIKLYVDGVLVDTTNNVSVHEFNQVMFRIGSGSGDTLTTSYGYPAKGEVDEAALWNVALTSNEVKQIYNRQKQNYAGHYDSPVIDLGTSGSWTDLKTITSLPFGKEITASAESSADYNSMAGDLSDGLVGYWPMNENQSYNGTTDEMKDKSVNGNHGTAGSTIDSYSLNSLGGKYFDISDSAISIPNDSTINPNNEMTVSFWMLSSTEQDYGNILYKRAGGVGWSIGQKSDQGITLRIDTSGGANQNLSSVQDLFDGKIHHVVAIFNNGTYKLYVDGLLDNSNTYAHGTGFANSSDLILGANTTVFPLALRDFSMWSKELTTMEIQELYRRGANRVKYQVKSCVDSSCNCKSFNTAPVGSANDCDGDGTLNSSDKDDSYMAEFIGPGGSGATSYGELFNRAAGDLTFSCATNTTDSDTTICMNDEITLAGNTKTTSPSFTFGDMATSAAPTNNRYFQYRVLMEAEENTACSGEACMPDLTSVEVGPSGRYYGGSPVIASNKSFSYSAIDSLVFSKSGSCSINFQLSPDGSTYYFWNGSTWTTASGENLAESASSTNTSNNISSFAATAGTGDLYFKAFMTSDTTQDCLLDNIAVEIP